MRILVVDDAKFMRLMLGNILKKFGHEVFEAENGQDALEKYPDVRPDLVTMDITMPEMDGLEAVKKIKELDPDATVAVISAMGQKDFVMDAIVKGASDFLVKPFQEEGIRAMLEKVAQNKLNQKGCSVSQ